VLHEWHGTYGGWILSPENFVPDGFRPPQVNADDYRPGGRVW
jgi:hypothetical protein